MVKKKISGQTIAIIVLALLLVISIMFGGVYAFYSAKSAQVSGTIEMANLKINLVDGNSGVSAIVISSTGNVIPGQPLNNSLLSVINLSELDIYVVVVYKINAYWEDEDKVKHYVQDACVDPVISFGTAYANSIFPSKNNLTGKSVINEDWVDYVFKAEDTDVNAQEIKLDKEGTQTCRGYRCIVSRRKWSPSNENDKSTWIKVIGAGELALAGAMGNDYQGTTISFTLQAYSIGASSFAGTNSLTGKTLPEQCETIVSAVYSSQVVNEDGGRGFLTSISIKEG